MFIIIVATTRSLTYARTRPTTAHTFSGTRRGTAVTARGGCRGILSQALKRGIELISEGRGRCCDERIGGYKCGVIQIKGWRRSVGFVIKGIQRGGLIFFLPLCACKCCGTPSACSSATVFPYANASGWAKKLLISSSWLETGSPGRRMGLGDTQKPMNSAGTVLPWCTSW